MRITLLIEQDSDNMMFTVTADLCGEFPYHPAVCSEKKALEQARAFAQSLCVRLKDANLAAEVVEDEFDEPEDDS